MRWVAGLVVGAGVGVGCGVATGQSIYSVDVLSDRLVRVDEQSGTVSPVGALGVDVERADLTTFEGQIYMVTNSDAGSDTRLYRVSANTGAATFLSDIDDDPNGRTVEFGDALASDSTGLILGYDAQVNGLPVSFVYGRLGEDGGVSEAFVLSGCQDGCDSDGAGYDSLLDVVVTVSGREDLERNDWGVFEFGDGDVINEDSTSQATAMGLLNDIAVDEDFAFAVSQDPDGGNGALVIFERIGSEWDVGDVQEIVGDPVRLMGVTLASQGDCAADLDGDGDADASDFFGYLDLFAAGDSRADIDRDGDIDAEDFFGYLDLFAAGC